MGSLTPYYSDEYVTIYHGDCRDILPDLPKVDLVLTDPPYGIDYQSAMRVATPQFPKIVNDNNNNRLVVYRQLHELLNDNSVIASFCSFKNYAHDYNELSKYCDIKNVLIWFKRGGGIGDLSHSLLTDYEMVIIAHKGNAVIRGKRNGSVWETAKVPPSSMLHPTEKPIGIIRKIIDTFSDATNLILDPFMGSGTTLVAAKSLNRKAIGIEIEERYCEIAAKRCCQGVLELGI